MTRNEIWTTLAPPPVPGRLPRGFLRLLAGGFVLAALSAGAVGSASAQLDNRPYEFRGGASVGMSQGGREAILREKLYGETPDNLIRDRSGRLLQLQEGPGNSAIVSDRGGQLLPGYRGSSALRPELGRQVGVFNPFFFGVGRSAVSSYSAFYVGGAGSRVSIARWTDMVTDGGPSGMVSSGPSPVDSWTSQVFLYFGP